MMKKAELLKTEHMVQQIWLKNQISKINFSTGKNFLNSEVALRAWDKLDSGLVIREADLEHYISVHLSEQGIKKLVTTLRVHKKRSGKDLLQVEITDASRRRLSQIAKISGKTKKEIIDYLILNADLSEFEPIE
ncbi:hypothetical protein Sps_04719 [Shewanella psychrophila]|uniref:Uncharacterized protein n=1 Tax=Shewanella psychrophila TaxID=225848 RepID=A0A1S6HWE8_9GAMM|nr:hypothetical protein [Shewanella psychrophila]AQS39802.1 hypothetical protein Sps_04719 [Shewanella psychrophila]